MGNHLKDVPNTKNRPRYFRKRSGKTRQLPFLSPRQVIETGHVGTGPAAAGLAPDGTPPGPPHHQVLEGVGEVRGEHGQFLGLQLLGLLDLVDDLLLSLVTDTRRRLLDTGDGLAKFTASISKVGRASLSPVISSCMKSYSSSWRILDCLRLIRLTAHPVRLPSPSISMACLSLRA